MVKLRMHTQATCKHIDSRKTSVQESLDYQFAETIPPLLLVGPCSLWLMSPSGGRIGYINHQHQPPIFLLG